MEILVIKTTSLGDVLHATSALPILRANFPGARITWVVDRVARDLVRHHPDVSRTLVSDFRAWQRGWWRHPLRTLREMLALLGQLRDTRYDLALDLQGLFRTVVLLCAARSPAKFVKGRWPFLRGFGDKKRLHALTEIRRVLETAGLKAFDAPMCFATTAVDREAAESLLWEDGAKAGRIVVVCPFTGWPSKTWRASHFAELIQKLPSDVTVFVTGDAASQEAAERLLRQAARDKARNLCGRLDLGGFAELVRRADAVLCGESFSGHVASAVGAPVAILFGPTDEKRIGPVGTRFRILRAPDCRVCYNPRCRKGCLDQITPGQALAAVLELMAEGRPGVTT